MNFKKRLFTILMLIICIGAFAQKQLDTTEIKYFIDFFQSNETVDFLQPNKDTTITAYDVDGILKNCNIKAWGHKKLKIMTEGVNIDRIKADGIFTSLKDSTDFIIVSKNTIDKVVYYRIFRPRTGADGHFGIKKVKQQYIKQKTSYGWF